MMPAFPSVPSPSPTARAARAARDASSQFTDGATDSDLITSIYYDSPRRTLYDGRVDNADALLRQMND